MRSWQKWDDSLGRIEKFFVAGMLGVMILLAFLQIVLRNVFSSGISWGDPLVRYLVLWVGFIGASLATKESKHQQETTTKTNKNRLVYVHCVHGRTRSAAIVCYLLARRPPSSSDECWTIQQAYEWVRTKRDIFLPDTWLDALQSKLNKDLREG